MKKIISILILFVFVVLVSGCTSSNTSNQSTQNVTVQITTTSPWNGTLTYNGSDHNITGTGNSNYNLGTNPGAVTIYLRNNNDNGNLTVDLLQGGKTIQTQSTSPTQEVVTISQNF
jgi:hypothetical protein